VLDQIILELMTNLLILNLAMHFKESFKPIGVRVPTLL
jgi:hypothetical protein